MLVSDKVENGDFEKKKAANGQRSKRKQCESSSHEVALEREKQRKKRVRAADSRRREKKIEIAESSRRKKNASNIFLTQFL